MRIHPWLAALSGVLLLFAAGESSARAQQAPDTVFDSGGFDEALEGSVRLRPIASTIAKPSNAIRGQSPGGVVFESAYDNQNPAVLWPQGTPQSYQPYPQISPYYSPNVSRNTTFNRDGLWFRELLHRQREYFLTLEYLMVRYRNPGNAVVGAQPARFFRTDRTAPGGQGGQGGQGGAGTSTVGGVVGAVINNHGLAGPAEFGIGTGGSFQRASVGPGVFPFPLVFETPAQNARNSVFDETLFPIRSMGLFGNAIRADGLRARWGYFNEDDSGVMLTGWYGSESYDRFQLGRAQFRGIPVTPDFIEANSPTGGSALVFPRNGSLPLLTRDDFVNSGADPQPDFVTLGFTGIAQKFDILFSFDVQTFAAGGALHLYHEPIYKRKWLTVRPMFGARYQYLDERFTFRGIDSGFGYDLDFGSSGNNNNNNQQTSTFRPDSNDVFRVSDGNAANGDEDFFFEANLESQSFSHMAGPEAGLRYDFGSGKHFAIWGQSSVALLANREKIQLSGRNIGDPVNYFLVTGDNWVNPIDQNNPIDTRFANEETHTRASPMFEQSVFVDLDVFRFVPVLRNLHVLENARFRTGYTYTVIGQVARPGELIEWRNFPDFPTIRSNRRQTWSTHNWSFAIDWTF